MKYRAFGLDIGVTTMKAVWLSEEKGVKSLAAVAQARTLEKGMLSESPFDQQEIARSIKTMIDEAKITTKLVNISLPDNQVYTRVIEIPILSEKELGSAIYWEAEQYIPLPLENVTLDWNILKKPSPSEPTKMEVLLVGAPTMLLDKYQKVLTFAGLVLNVVETEILATIRSIVATPHFPSSIIVHIGALSTSLAIIKDGSIVFTYSIAIGGVALDRAIASNFGFTLAQAEEYKKTYGVSQHSLGGKIGKATSPVFMSIITEIKKALAFYREKYKSDLPIQQILLSGPEAKLPGIDLFFAQNCGIETVIANPFRQQNIESAPKEVLDNAPNYTVAVGLAMREYE